MNILIICSANSGKIMPFITEQGDELIRQGHEVDYLPVRSKGIKGYLKHLPVLKAQLKEKNYHLVHAHYGLSGALAVLQRQVPVVITFHNGETLTRKGNLVSSVASLFSVWNIYVAQHIYDLTYFKQPRHSTVLPCGIPVEKFVLYEKQKARELMGLPADKINVLFGGAFANLRKNVALAQEAVRITGRNDIHLVELKGYNREQVNQLLCAVDFMLLPTKSEGSPQIVKEAMACNCPIVATDVADIAVLMNNTPGTFLTGFDPHDVANKIEQAIAFGQRTSGRGWIEQYDNGEIVKQIVDIYHKII
jgi:glycosyltransferase involved in cell wall biosynthesis